MLGIHAQIWANRQDPSAATVSVCSQLLARSLSGGQSLRAFVSVSKKQVAECELSFPARGPCSYLPTSLGPCYNKIWCLSHAGKHATLLKGSSTGLSDTVQAPGEELGSRAVAGRGDSSSGLAMAVSVLPLSDLGSSQ